MCPFAAADLKASSLKRGSLVGAATTAAFDEAVVSLRSKLVSRGSDVRSMRGLRLSKAMVVNLMQSLLEDANSQDKFDFDKAVALLLENEFVGVHRECVDLYKSVMGSQFGDAEFMSLQQLEDSLRSSREEVYYLFFKLKEHDTEQAEAHFLKYHDHLRTFICEMEANFREINN